MPTSETYKLLIDENKLDEFRILLANNPNDMDYLIYFVRSVVLKNNIQFMEMLMYDFNYDPINDDNYAISLCVQRYVNIDMTKFFLDLGIDIHFSKYKCVYFDSDNKVISTKNITGKPDFLFSNICGNFHYEKIKLLLEHGVNPNTQNGNCYIQLLGSKVKDYLKAVLLFIEYGFDITCNDNDPLLYAIYDKKWPLVKLLLENGANMEIVNKRLNEQTDEKDRKIINFLKEYGADIYAISFL